MSDSLSKWCALGVALTTFASPRLSFAQGQLPDVAPLGAAPQPGKGGGAPPPSGDQPETHAAPGGSDSTLPEGNEPSLPENPLEMTEETKKTIGSDGDATTLGTDGSTSEREFYGLYYNEKAGEYRYRVAFPFWAERLQPSAEDPKIQDRASVYGGLYYQRRAAGAKDDVLFPIAWNLQNPLEKSRTTIVGPFVNRRTPEETDDWLAPLYMTGTRKDGGYTIIPPLLTGLTSDAEGGLNVIGPAFCSWKGGADCDTRSASDIDLGIVPFYFFGQNQHRVYEVIPPLFHYYNYTERSRSWVNIYGPYYREHTEKRELFHLLPFYWSIEGENERHTTVAPFFHYGYKGKENLLITPLFLNKNGEDGSNTFVTWGYARHRGRTELDMITPLFWHHREPSIGLDRKLLLPFLYTNTSPREATTTFFPFWSYRERYGVSESLWVTPLFNYQKFIQGWSVSLLPSFFFGKDGNSSHSVVAPFFFDFASPRNRTTIGLPFYFRSSDLDSVMQVIGPVYYSERRYKNGLDWQIHLLPLFSYGQTPDGHFWNVLFGLTGYTRAGSSSTLRALWVPIQLSE